MYLSFYGFLRPGEFSVSSQKTIFLKKKQLSWSQDHLVLSLPSTKTSQTGPPIQIRFFKSENAWCPVVLDSGPGTVERPSPSFSGRSTRRFDEVRVPRTALVVDEYQRRSREDSSSVEEGPLAVVEAAVSSRCPASVVQRVVQAVQEEQPSTSRSYDGAVSVRQESGSTAAGVTAPVVPGRMMAALVWILGHSYVFWGAIRADVRPSGRQLGVSPELATVRWLGVRGMLWGGVLREISVNGGILVKPKNVKLDACPEKLVFLAASVHMEQELELHEIMSFSAHQP
ncbi:uncharacterized protein LOC120997330 [Bufo bufo]|uniref:uncharacterized protein LOC120997330 n=1 Tax=Bufo bufo TaxID=8384 RepID=UPI001ABE6817|nr:uncharacterized protein LOC120997330 [Bufo bufo]